MAARFVELLADTGVSHGLIGPREVPRLWERHVLNCAVIQDAFPRGTGVIDVGSGAGLPGIAVAIARPDVELDLVEPMQRRTDWLHAVVDELGLDRVQVHRARAEDCWGTLSRPYVTARAVARLETLVGWCSRLVDPGGLLVALKGRSAGDELERTRPTLARLGMSQGVIARHGEQLLDEPTITIELRRLTAAAGPRRRR